MRVAWPQILIPNTYQLFAKPKWKRVIVKKQFFSFSIFLHLDPLCGIKKAFSKKTWNLFFGCSFFTDGFSKKLVSIWYEDLRSGYVHVKFQPDCSKGVDSTAIRRSETFATLAILYPHGWPSNFVCWNAWALRSFWQIFIQRAQSRPKIWPKTRFFTFS